MLILSISSCPLVDMHYFTGERDSVSAVQSDCPDMCTMEYV